MGDVSAAGEARDGAGERIGVLGGTFDPPHVAHLALGEAAWRRLGLDRVIFVPAGDPWRKADRRVSPASRRLELVRAAVRDLPWAEVSTLEVDRPGPSYSQETLATLHIERPEAQLWFILGADALTDMPHWHEPERIIEIARLAVATRPGAPRDAGDSGALVRRTRDVSAAPPLVRRRRALARAGDALLVAGHASRERRSGDGHRP